MLSLDVGGAACTDLLNRISFSLSPHPPSKPPASHPTLTALVNSFINSQHPTHLLAQHLLSLSLNPLGRLKVNLMNGTFSPLTPPPNLPHPTSYPSPFPPPASAITHALLLLCPPLLSASSPPSMTQPPPPAPLDVCAGVAQQLLKVNPNPTP